MKKTLLVVAGWFLLPAVALADCPDDSEPARMWSGGRTVVVRADGYAHVSVNAGRTFCGAEELSGDVAVAVDRRGTIWGADAESQVLIRRTRRGKVVRTAAPKLAKLRGPLELKTAGGWIVVHEDLDLEDGALLATRDRGRRWYSQVLPECGNNDCQFTVLGDGGWSLMTGFEAGCGGGYQERHLGRLDATSHREGPWPWDSPLFATAGDHVFGFCDDEAANVPCSIDRKGVVRRLEPGRHIDELGPVGVSRTGRQLVAAGSWYGVRKAGLWRRAALPERTDTLLGFDRRDRPVVLAEAVIYGRTARGWRTIARLPNPAPHHDTDIQMLGTGELVALQDGRLYRHTCDEWQPADLDGAPVCGSL